MRWLAVWSSTFSDKMSLHAAADPTAPVRRWQAAAQDTVPLPLKLTFPHPPLPHGPCPVGTLCASQSFIDRPSVRSYLMSVV